MRNADHDGSNEAGGNPGLDLDEGEADALFDGAVPLDAETLYKIAIGDLECDAPEIMRAARRFVAFTMRRQGHGYREIAVILKVSLSTAYGYVADTIKKLIREEVDQVRQIQIDRINALIVGYWDKAEAGDTFSANVVLQLMSRLDTYYGIEPPKRVEHTFTGEAVDDARRELAKVFAALGHEATNSGSLGPTVPGAT